jgi:hypothetical protein
MSSPQGADIRDAAHWNEAKAPVPTIERQRYDAAVLSRDAIGKRMREWQAPRTGDDYDALRLEWIRAVNAADTAYDAMIAAANGAQA